MIDTVTVVFREEIPFLRVQARSLDLYTRDIDVGKVIVVVNDESDVVQMIDPAWWGRLASRVEIIPAQRWCDQIYHNGWVSQQALKILAADAGISQWSMILDAKTFLMKNIDPGRLIHGDRVCMGHNVIAPVFSESLRLVNQLFNINMTQLAGPAGVPHFFNRKLVSSLIDYMGRDKFYQWFLDQGMITEFVLYSGWVHHQLGHINLLYSEKTNYQVTNICHSQVNQIGFLLKLAQREHNLTIGMHRNAWKAASNKHKLDYLQILESVDLITTMESVLVEWDSVLT